MFEKTSDIILFQSDKKEEGLDIEPSEILQKSFCYLIIGPPGSGKTSLIQNLILHEKLYFRKFHFILYISPSSIDKLDMKIDENWWYNINVSWLDKKLNAYNEIGKTHGCIIHVLLVLDDCVADLKKMDNDQFINQLFFNRRHLLPNMHICIIIVSQKYNMIPQKYRVMNTGLFLFKIPKTQIDDVAKEIILPNSKGFLKSFESLLKNKHDFIYINNNNECLFLNFNKILF
jgi:GTPase SAR1 family protein